jgi:hypothetical protein
VGDQLLVNKRSGAIGFKDTNNYFSDTPYLTKHNPYFVQKQDAAKRLGFLPLKKATAAMQMLAYGYSADSVDEYLQI